MSLAEVDATYGDEDRRSSRSSAGDRTPPQDLIAEQSVLGAMLMSKDAIADVVEVLRGPDFYRPAHELVYDAVLDLYGRGEPADAITVAAELTRRGNIARVGGAPYLHDLLASTSIAANAGYYAEIVREKAILRRLADASIRIGQMSYAAEGDVNDIVDRAQAEVYSVTDKRTSEDYKSLSELMQPTMDEIEAIGSRGGQLAGVPTGFADLDDLTNGMHPGQMIIVAARPGMGKALALDTPLPTPSGWTTMGQVQVGDRLIGADGMPTRVIAATEVMRDRECFEITFSDGSSVIADGQHEWPVTSSAARRAATDRRSAVSHDRRQAIRRVEVLAIAARHEPETYRSIAELIGEVGVEFRQPLRAISRRLSPAVRVTGVQPVEARPEPKVVYPRAAMLSALAARITRSIGGDASEPAESVTTAELARQVRLTDGRCNWAVTNAAPLHTSEIELPLAPYLLGSWLAGGHSAGRVCSDDHGSVRELLTKIGVLADKHIPPAYLRASERQRRDLLAGLLDTDGRVRPDGAVEIALADRRLAADVYELIVSLGYRCNWRERAVAGPTPDTATAYLLSFTSGDDVFGLPRRRDHHRSTRPTAVAPGGSRYITEVRPVGRVPVRCVQVDNDDHLYLATRSMIPTHNSTIGLDLARSASIKSGLASAIFSLEMSQIEIVMRLLSAEASIPLNHIRNGKMNDDDWQRMAKKMGEVAEAPLFIDDSPNLTMMEIRAKARRLRQRHDLKLIIIDYLQLLTSGKKVESRQVEVSEFSRQLKLLAKELELPVVALAQLNRGPETRGGDKKPMLSDLRESGSLEQDADMVILLNRPDIYDKESERAGEADFDVAKHRNGPTKTITVAFQGHYSRFIDMHQ
ncbi:MAG TPA: replicative DNA helicase [Microlunatus sp.]